ncbi:MAG TPA: type II secretion system F family protein [Methylomirabilota bacterium]|jgi:type IV pilus assembly protein PilC|nr:type II secretion system F family protein [Methylomirabilota bacterium]
MPTFTYKGVNAGGGAVNAEITAADERTAARQLRSQGITVQSIAAKRAAAAGIDLSSIPVLGSFFGGVRSKDVSVFTRQFATMISAGLPLVQCLQALGQQAERKRFQDIIAKVSADVEGGATLSEAMARHPKVFDELYVNLVHVGEIGGVLDSMLARLAVYMEKADALKHRVKMATVYPVLVVTVAIGVVTFLLIFIIPIFSSFYEKAGVPLPAPTAFVVGASNFIRNYWYGIIGVAAGMFFAFRAWYGTDQGKTTVDRFLLRAPIFGVLLRKIAVARFTRTLSALISGGVPILDALKITAKTAGNRIVENAVMEARERVTAGQTLAEPLRQSKVFPAMVVQMVSVGEQTGALDNMLAKVADYYEDEVDVAVSGLTALLEPIMIVFLGIVVGGIVISMYLPIFQVITLVK